MIDINLIRQNPKEVEAALLKRMDEISFDELLAWDLATRAKENMHPELPLFSSFSVF